MIEIAIANRLIPIYEINALLIKQKTSDVNVETSNSGMNANTIKPETKREKSGGSQTLVRGLKIVEAVAAGRGSLNEIAEYAGLARSTAYRLASTLVEQGYLSVAPRDSSGGGYRLGPKFIRLSQQAVNP
ncbi:MAG: helix-turn-helix domain-containing protein [Asticcacaulis sp.]